MKDSNEVIIQSTKMINDTTEARAKAKSDMTMAELISSRPWADWRGSTMRRVICTRAVTIC